MLRLPPNLAGEKLGCQRGVDSAQQPTRKRKGDVASDKLTLIVFFCVFFVGLESNFLGYRKKNGIVSWIFFEAKGF